MHAADRHALGPKLPHDLQVELLEGLVEAGARGPELVLAHTPPCSTAACAGAPASLAGDLDDGWGRARSGGVEWAHHERSAVQAVVRARAARHPRRRQLTR